ncbi:hypothetical protein KBY75_13795 [Cyanobium sp. T1G-Tous]|uniref:hypothetical protein n=1 Tax=Cyanobium sp. T1G-Tous TaxID=2823722 RepID=UPI0020CBCEC5|nr:hypothetical protein [Cyanobium sp. T1G-Tous]MCP9804637.1 hypothetical protein [Cyanobium sp. T1G-Tous]
MLLVSERLRLRQSSKQPLARHCPHSYIDAGFSVVEGIIASVILIVAVMGTVAAFNLITSSISGTSKKNAANIAIDKDISLIKKLSVEYTSCVNPVGSVPGAGAACDVTNNFSNYYFPKSALVSDQNQFFAACRSTNPGSHITAGFKTAIDAISADLGAGIVRQPAIREDGADPQNHNIIVEYKISGSSVRLIKVSPVVSSWCG